MRVAKRILCYRNQHSCLATLLQPDTRCDFGVGAGVDAKGFLATRHSPLATFECLAALPQGALLGDHTGKVTPVPIPNTVVKLSGPMIVPTSAKVGIAIYFKNPAGLPSGGVFARAGIFLQQTFQLARDYHVWAGCHERSQVIKEKPTLTNDDRMWHAPRCRSEFGKYLPLSGDDTSSKVEGLLDQVIAGGVLKLNHHALFDALTAFSFDVMIAI